MSDTLALQYGGKMRRDTRLVFDLLEPLQHGVLEIRMPDGTFRLFGRGEPVAHMQVRDEAVFSRILARGDIGLAEAYIDGLWDSPDIACLTALLARNRAVLKSTIYGQWHRLLAARIRHLFNANSRSGSRRNILAHYDLGNAFYAKWLDETMSYSAALYDAQTPDLRSAQLNKYRRILDKLHARPGDRVLEIGCGWGGFAEMAAERQLKVFGVTLSPAQLAWARKRVPGAELLLRDYRDIGEQYDHIVSIEMFEAVGERWWPTYFNTLRNALRPDGKAIVQSITIRDDLFASYRRGTDFIQQYIFPGGMLPSREAFRKTAARHGLIVREEFAFGQDYARTLAEWRKGFEERWPEIAALGFDDRFHRLWRMYLGYCEGAFRAGNVDVVQFELAHA